MQKPNNSVGIFLNDRQKNTKPSTLPSQLGRFSEGVSCVPSFSTKTIFGTHNLGGVEGGGVGGGKGGGRENQKTGKWTWKKSIFY